MTLVEQKRINLDVPVNQYLGDAKVHSRVGNAEEATISRVANHSSGLPRHERYFPEPSRPPSTDETILRFANLITTPGSTFEYSNLGYTILGQVISRVSGQSYEDYRRENVFMKLGLTHTSVGTTPELEKFVATRFESKDRPLPKYDVDHRPAAGIYSSAHDLVRFGMFHLKAHIPNQAPIISDISIDEMQRRTIVSNAANGNGYGIGWWIRDGANGYHTVSHPGRMPGVSTRLFLIPSEKLVVVVLVNTTDERYVAKISDDVLASILPDWKKTNPSPNPAQPAANPRPATPATVSPALIGRWTGILPGDSSTLTLEISASGEINTSLGPDRPLRVDSGNVRDALVTAILDASNSSGFQALRVQLELRDGVLSGTIWRSIQHRPFGDTFVDWVDFKKN